ncbi:MAG: hypothetical protein IT388_06495 [Nitrospirales bacterium]|nr:hypothetical protein [Nitrospirales bacterium]
MIITAGNAVQLLLSAISIGTKAYQALKTGEPQSIEEEVGRLNAALPRSSEEVIASADAQKM